PCVGRGVLSAGVRLWFDYVKERRHGPSVKRLRLRSRHPSAGRGPVEYAQPTIPSADPIAPRWTAVAVPITTPLADRFARTILQPQRWARLRAPPRPTHTIHVGNAADQTDSVRAPRWRGRHPKPRRPLLRPDGQLPGSRPRPCA